MFLQVHFLTSYHASLLNRDDAGLAKRISFGGQERLRISSQCQKRHWREWMISRAGLPHGVRSRHFFGRVVEKQLVDGGMDETLAHTLTFTLANIVIKTSSKNDKKDKDAYKQDGKTEGKKKKDAVDTQTLDLAQPALFGEPEADYFASLIREAATRGSEKEAVEHLQKTLDRNNHKQNFQALLHSAGFNDPHTGFEGALFGRFVTSDILARVDAPVHVAHAFTTHALDTEVDFFSVVDDLSPDGETGAAHIGDMELGAGLFYGYVAVDIPLLVSNLTGYPQATTEGKETAEARALLNLLIQGIAEVSPGAKLGATAPYARAGCVLLEAGSGQPRSLANAFLQPIRLGRADAHPMAQSVDALAAHLGAVDAMYGGESEHRWVASLHPWPRQQETCASLPVAIADCLDTIFGGRP